MVRPWDSTTFSRRSAFGNRGFGLAVDSHPESVKFIDQEESASSNDRYDGKGSSFPGCNAEDNESRSEFDSQIADETSASNLQQDSSQFFGHHLYLISLMQVTPIRVLRRVHNLAAMPLRLQSSARMPAPNAKFLIDLR